MSEPGRHRSGTETGPVTDTGAASEVPGVPEPATGPQHAHGGEAADEARRALRPMIVESIGGWRGMIDSGLPVVVFVIANAVAGLTPAIWSALGAGAVLFVLRLARKQSPQQAVSGLFGVAIAAFIAWRMGEARGYFLLGIWRNAIYGGVFLISVLVRRPLVGVIWEFVEGGGQEWRQNARLRRTYIATTLMWAGVFAARVLVQRLFYNRDETGWLAVTSLVMGYPLYIAALGATFLWVRRAKRALRPEAA